MLNSNQQSNCNLILDIPRYNVVKRYNETTLYVQVRGDSYLGYGNPIILTLQMETQAQYNQDCATRQYMILILILIAYCIESLPSLNKEARH